MALSVESISNIDQDNPAGLYDKFESILSLAYNAAMYPLFASYDLACNYLCPSEVSTFTDLEKPSISLLPTLPSPDHSFNFESIKTSINASSELPQSTYGMIKSHLESSDFTQDVLNQTYKLSLDDLQERKHQIFQDFCNSTREVLDKHSTADTWKTLQMVSSVLLTGVTTTLGLSLLGAASTPAIATGGLLTLSGLTSMTALGLSYNDIYPKIAMGLTFSSIALGAISGAGYFSSTQALPSSSNVATGVLSILRGGSTIGKGLTDCQIEKIDAQLIMIANKKTSLDRKEQVTKDAYHNSARSYEVQTKGLKEILETLKKIMGKIVQQK